MALGKFASKDWFAGFLVALASGAGKNNVYVPAVTLVDSSGNPTSGSDITIAGPLGQKTMAGSVSVTFPSDQSTITTQQAGFSFTNITTSTTTTVKSGAGVLHLVNINADGTVASVTTVYDSLVGSGTKIATINSLNLSGPFQYDIAFSTGLTIVTTGAPDITVSWR
jgi:hypothetical protein